MIDPEGNVIEDFMYDKIELQGMELKLFKGEEVSKSIALN